MYKPLDEDNPQYPVFAKVNGRIISFLSRKAVLIIGITIVLCASLFIAADSIKQWVDTPLPATEKARLYDNLKAQRAAVQYQRIKSDMAAYEEEGVVRPNLSLEEKQAYQDLKSRISMLEVALSVYNANQRDDLVHKAKEAGIGQASDDELEAMVPNTKPEEVPVIDDFLRFILFVFIPVGIVISLVVEIGGSISGIQYFLDCLAFRRKQKTYFFRRMEG